MSAKLIARITHRPGDRLPWAVDVAEEGVGLIGFTSGLGRQSMVDFARRCAYTFMVAFGECTLEIVGDDDPESDGEERPGLTLRVRRQQMEDSTRFDGPEVTP
ncbi:hypothetical protein ACQP1O_42865 (plasmid) [Nocardia sp. CA-151230]|uniref:hypothetical protein n=1 Tax=Nocardia sp. CA-151230 TaxID=3239982 RepID=UPI003D903903